MEVSTDHIIKVFLDIAPYPKFYSTYANDFRDASKLMDEFTEKSKSLQAADGEPGGATGFVRKSKL